MSGLTHHRPTWQICIAAALALAFAPVGHAAPTITISDGKKKDTVTLTNAAGLIAFDGKVGKFTLSLSTTPVTGLDMLPTLTLESLTYGAKKAGTLTISLSDTSVLPTDGTIASKINGKTGGSVSFATYADAGNNLFGKSTLLNTQGNLTGSAFAGSGDATFAAGSPFSLTETFVIHEVKRGNTAFDATLVDPPAASYDDDVIAVDDGPAPVPETGSTMALLVMSLLGMEVIRRNLKPMQRVPVRAKFRC